MRARGDGRGAMARAGLAMGGAAAASRPPGRCIFFSLLGVGSGFTVGPLRRCSRGPLPLRGAAVDEASLRGFEDLASSRWANTRGGMDGVLFDNPKTCAQHFHKVRHTMDRHHHLLMLHVSTCCPISKHQTVWSQACHFA